jgi:DNA modification methylase
MSIGIETNIIYQGDCKEILKNFPSDSIDLIYVDPPFFSNKTYEIVWGNGAELRAFEDRWKGGIMNYVEWMKERIEQMHRVLKPTGVFVIHLDWHANSYIRVFVLDKLFDNNLVNEIIWCYTGPRKTKNAFARKHDMIYVYSKSKNYPFNSQRVPYKSGLHNIGQVFQSKEKRNQAVRKMEKEGKMLEDWWTDIWATERYRSELMGYPTQKPIKLLERIISAFSKEDSIVLDPMMGGGTTLVATQKLNSSYNLNRRWIGIDVSPLACKLTAKRLRKFGVSSVSIISGLITEKELKKFNHFEFQKWVCDKLFGKISSKKTGDMGIDGYTLDMTPIQVKQSDAIGRVEIDKFGYAVERVKKNKGVFVAFSFGRGANEEVAKAKLERNLDIKLITVKQLLEKQNIEDLLDFK